ncbi:MAG: heavy-metal-associated domain-containing protein [Gammaproteobacteria bacterium]|jgi:copper chaperone
MALDIQVDNIKCGGCVSTIRTKLEEAFEAGVSVDIQSGVVTIDSPDELRPQIVARLEQLGYPESGTSEGLGKATAKARSFVSCAIGRMSSTDDD